MSQSPHQPPVTPPPAQPSRGFRAWIRRFRTAVVGGAGIAAGAAITVLVTTYLPHGVTSGINALTGPSVPFTADVRIDPFDRVFCRTHVVTTPPAAMRIPPVDPPDTEVWWANQGAVDADTTTVEILLEGRAAQVVNILGLSVHVIHKAQPIKGNAYRISGCGGAVPARLFSIDLDRPVPLVRPQVSEGIDPSTGQVTKLNPIAFPYSISDTDPEDFLITARTSLYDCTWQLRLEWSSNRSNHTATIPGNGGVFRTTSSRRLPRYVLAQGPGGGWQKDHGQ